MAPGARAQAPDFGQAILPVGTLPIDGIPKDGEEYLAMVRHEASLHPPILAQASWAYESPDVAQDTETKEADTKTWMPTSAWRSVFVKRFQRLRLCMATLRPSSTARVRLPSVDDETGWYRFVHGRLPPSEKDRNDMVAQCRAASHIPPSIDDSGSIDMDTTVSTSDSEDEVDGLLPSYKGPEDLFASWDYVFSTPTMAMLGTLDSTEALTLTKYFRKWIQHPHFTEYRMQVHSMHEVHAQWLFALLARIDQHLISDDIATLRVLARACMKNIVRTRTASHMHVPASDGALSAESGAWMILVLLAGVWGQWDLWDETQARLQCVEERK